MAHINFYTVTKVGTRSIRSLPSREMSETSGLKVTVGIGEIGND